MVLAFRAAAVRHASYFAQDFQVSFAAARNFVHGQPIYSTDSGLLPFLYPPPSAIAWTPLTILRVEVAEGVALAVGVAALVLAAVASARLAVRAGAAQAGTSGLALLLVAVWQPSFDALGNVNSTLLLAPVVPAFLLLSLRRRYLLAAVLLGLSLALKPLLLPLLVVPLLHRRPLGMLVALAIPALTTAVSLPFVADSHRFFSDVLPKLVSGDAGRLGVNNMSLANLGTLAGVDEPVVLAIRLVVVVVSVLVAVAVFRGQGNETLRLVEVTGVLMVGFISAGGTDESHFQLVLLPLVVSILAPGSHLRSVLGGLGVVLFAYAGPVVYLSESLQASKSLWRATGLVLVLTAMAVSVLREQHRSRLESVS